MIRVTVLGEELCPDCHPCACGKEPSTIDPIYGVRDGKKCLEIKRKKYKPMPKTHRSINSLLNYAATPFWKIMGLPPKKEEIRAEREMKRRGLTYRDVQMMNRTGKNARYNASQIQSKALKGELKNAKPVSYRKQGATRQSS